MRVLLLNPNMLRTPPVPPIGLEVVAAFLKGAGHDTRMLDLCFADDPLGEVRREMREFRPEAVGVTVRNIDSVLFAGNEFYLDGIRRIVAMIVDEFGLPVFAGGAGLRADPEGITGYIGANAGFVGHAGHGVAECLDWVVAHPGERRIFIPPQASAVSCRRHPEGVDYGRYLREGGIAGFFTHTGCSSSCAYCIEANSPVHFREPGEVVHELRCFKEQGISSFHLCDSEFNEDREFCLEFLDCLEKSELNIAWSLYLKPAEHSRRMFRALFATGARLVTLSIDSFRKCPQYWEDAEKIIFSARASGIRIVVDFITGFPCEDDDTLGWCMDFFRRVRPDAVNINTYIRLYRQLKITGFILGDPALRSGLIGWQEDSGLVKPVFYNRIPYGVLREKLQGDPLFRIDISGEGVNYSRFC